MLIDKLAVYEGSVDFYNPKSIRLLEQYMGLIINATNNLIVPLNQHSVFKYEGDFYGLLESMGVPTYMHWITMRINNIKSPCFFTLEKDFLIVPNEQMIKAILNKLKIKLE